MDKEKIESIVRSKIKVEMIEIEDDSAKHRLHPQSFGKGGHFNLTVVSPDFEGRGLVQRHQLIYSILDISSGQGIHALSIRAWTPSEWKKKQHVDSD